MKDTCRMSNSQAVSRRSFLQTGAGAAIAAGCLHGISTNVLAQPSAPTATAGKFVCPPCGQACDKLVFDQPGHCPNCGMTLIPLNGEGPPKVAVLIYNGAEIIDFAGPWEAFGTAGFLVHTVAESTQPHMMVFGQTIVPDYTFANSPKADVLLVPGGGYGEAFKTPGLIDWLKQKTADVAHVMSVCTGVMILAKAGLLDGLSATVTYGMEDDLAQFAPKVKVLSPRRFVDAGKIITTAGLTSGIDGALHLIGKMTSPGSAESVALGMEYNWSPNSEFSRAGLADRYLPDGLRFGRARLRGAQAEMISTAGDTSHWETKILVSDPKSDKEIIDLLTQRLAAPKSSYAERVAIAARPTASELRWTFVDDQAHQWRGMASSEAAADAKDKFVLLLKVSRA
jgi:putative intracellular protease/amidase